MRPSVFHALANAARQGERVALGLISGVKGSSPQKVGAKAIFHLDGRIDGTLGGGCLEAEIQQRALHCLRSGQAATFDLLLDHDFGWDDGLICGGKVLGLILPNVVEMGADFWASLAARARPMVWGVTRDFAIQLEDPQQVAKDWIYREPIACPCPLWIAGAGHIGQAVAPLAAQLDFQVTVFDDRPALANHHFFPDEILINSGPWEQFAAMPLPDSPAFALIVTRGHRHDALVLKDWIHKPFRFIGMIGSSRKARTIFEHFRQEQLASDQELARVSCPVGLRINARSVGEIAVSILAQFIQKRAEALEHVPAGIEMVAGSSAPGPSDDHRLI